MIRKAMAVNPYCSPIAHHVLWQDLFRQQAYLHAHEEPPNFGSRSLFWTPLINAATLRQMGSIEEAKFAAARLLALKPDFKPRGRILIGRCIKFDEIALPFIEGLNKVGGAVD